MVLKHLQRSGHNCYQGQWNCKPLTIYKVRVLKLEYLIACSHKIMKIKHIWMNKVWIIPYVLWEVGFEISHTNCMNQRCWSGIKNKAGSAWDHLTPNLFHMPLCICMYLCNPIYLCNTTCDCYAKHLKKLPTLWIAHALENCIEKERCSNEVWH